MYKCIILCVKLVPSFKNLVIFWLFKKTKENCPGIKFFSFFEKLDHRNHFLLLPGSFKFWASHSYLIILEL